MAFKKIVLDYLDSSIVYKNPSQWIDVFQEIASGEFSEVPQGVVEAFQKLSAHEVWEIVSNIASKGKKLTV